MTTLELINYTEQVAKELGYDGPYHDDNCGNMVTHGNITDQGHWFVKDDKEVSFSWEIEMDLDEGQYEILDSESIITGYDLSRYCDITASTKEEINKLFEK